MFRHVVVGNLERGDAWDALGIPLAGSGRSFAMPLIGEIVELTGGYPYFLQFSAHTSAEASRARRSQQPAFGPLSRRCFTNSTSLSRRPLRRSEPDRAAGSRGDVSRARPATAHALAPTTRRRCKPGSRGPQAGRAGIDLPSDAGHLRLLPADVPRLRPASAGESFECFPIRKIGGRIRFIRDRGQESMRKHEQLITIRSRLLSMAISGDFDMAINRRFDADAAGESRHGLRHDWLLSGNVALPRPSQRPASGASAHRHRTVSVAD